MTVDFGPTLNALLALVGPVLAATAAVLARAIIQHFNLKNNAVLSARITDAASRGAGVAFHMLQTGAASLDKVTIHNTAIAAGANYVATALPDAIASLGVSSDTLAAMVKGELGKLLAVNAAPAPGAKP